MIYDVRNDQYTRTLIDGKIISGETLTEVNDNIIVEAISGIQAPKSPHYSAEELCEMIGKEFDFCLLDIDEKKPPFCLVKLATVEEISRDDYLIFYRFQFEVVYHNI